MTEPRCKDASIEWAFDDPDEVVQIRPAFTPIETPDGKHDEVTGRITTGQVLRVVSDPQHGRPYVDEFGTALVELATAA